MPNNHTKFQVKTDQGAGSVGIKDFKIPKLPYMASALYGKCLIWQVPYSALYWVRGWVKVGLGIGIGVRLGIGLGIGSPSWFTRLALQHPFRSQG